MALDRDFAKALIAAMADADWTTVLPGGMLPNPLVIEFTRGHESRRLIVHARRITRQARSGTKPSDHNRPPGEMHTQMIFDGDQRGSGIKNTLRFAENAETVLFGFHRTSSGYIIAAYNPDRHREYAYSKSLQLKAWKIEEALRDGMAFQERKNGEVIVIFHINEITEYLDNAHALHNLGDLIAEPVLQQADIPPAVAKRKLERQTPDLDRLPRLTPADRKRRVAEVERFIRDRRFANGIRQIYERCAICGFQYDDVLDAAHIVPVSEGGTDTYDNGLGLCPNCHRMYDRGLILVDDTGRIFINLRYAEEYDQVGRADSLESLRTSLREYLWLPVNPQHHPSPENLRYTFEARR